MCCILENLTSDLFTLLREFVLDRGRVVGRSARSRTLTSGSGSAPAATCSARPATGGSLEAFVAEAGAKQRPEYDYKMMSKKGLLKFVKYTLIFSNAFGFILSIFLGLFGIAYPDKHFPLSYKGREMALCSLFCMLFTTIGYCGAQNHRRILLIIYGATNVIIVIIVVILWFLFRENSILGNKEISNMFITTLAITIAVMFLFAFILAFHIKTFKDDAHDSIVSQSHQLLQQTTAFLQQQQQHHHNHQQATSLMSVPGSGLAASIGGLLHPHNVNATLSNSLNHHHHHHQQQDHSSFMGGGGPTALNLQQPQAMAGLHMLPPPHARQQPAVDFGALMGGHQGQPMSADSGGFHDMPPGPVGVVQPLPQLSHAYLKASVSSTNQRQKKPSNLMLSQVPGAGINATPSQDGGGGSHQMTLMRNQSSPLPGVVPPPVQQGSSSRHNQIKTSVQHQQQHYSKSQKVGRAGQPPSSPPSPPPPPLVGGGGSSQPQSNPIHQHHHSTRDRSMGAGGRQLHPAACPVQYCTFDCDRTV